MGPGGGDGQGGVSSAWATGAPPVLIHFCELGTQGALEGLP